METKSIQNKPKILVILGPTATGKSDLAVKIAQKYNGEVISADSRQVYKGLNIGTGKITEKEKSGIAHHMIDVLSPEETFSAADWQKQVQKIILEILSRGKLPIICGGTGFYIQSIVDGIVLPEVPPNRELRKKLENKSSEELFSLLKNLDPERASNVDKDNPARLVRAIEIAAELGKVPEIKRKESEYNILQVGLTSPIGELREKIHVRLFARIREGMIEEIENLHRNGLSWERMEDLGLEYRYVSYFLQNKVSEEEMTRNLEKEIWQYSKRQMTWFKRDKNIKWFEPKEVVKIDKEVSEFLVN